MKTGRKISVNMEVSRHPEWQNALLPKGRKSRILKLVANSKTDYKIVLPAKPTSQESKAADELTRWFKIMTGVKFPVMYENNYSGGKVISIGDTAFVETAGIKSPREVLGDEGYEITVKGENLFLFGGIRRGPINAVLALLEEDLGLRWYDYRTATIPALGNLSVNIVLRRYVPVLELRDPYYWNAWDRDWSLRNRTSSPEARIPFEWGGNPAYPGMNFRERGESNHYDCWFVHTFDGLLPPAKYFKSHPEYFFQKNDERKPYQPCLSHPDVLKIVIRKIRELMKVSPDSRIIGVSLNDRNEYCECPDCKAFLRKEGSQSGVLLKFVNSVADAVRDKYPDLRILTLAYRYTIVPPKNIKPRDNVIIQLCTDMHAWKWPFLKITATPQFTRYLKQWVDIGANVCIWDYTVNFSYLPIPMPNFSVIGHAIKYYANHGAKGVMLEGGDQSYGSSDALLRCWVWTKQMWNSELDTIALMRDFIYGYYGVAAEPIWEYHRIMLESVREGEKKGKRSEFGNLEIYDIRYSPDVPFLNRRFLARAFKLFAQAEALADSSELRRRVQLAKLPVIYTKLSRELGVFHRFAPQYWLGSDSRIKALFENRKMDDLSEYLPLIEETAEIVKREKITFFAGGWHHCLPKGTNHAQFCLAVWREFANGLPDFHIHQMSNIWKFRTDPENCGLLERWFTGKIISKQWKKLECSYKGFVKAGWVLEPGLENYSGIGWYKQTFNVSEKLLAFKRIILVLVCARDEVTVWLNEHKVLEYTCEGKNLSTAELNLRELPLTATVKKWLRPGINQIAIRIKGKTWTNSFDQRCGLCKTVALIGSTDPIKKVLLGVLIENNYQLLNEN